MSSRQHFSAANRVCCSRLWPGCSRLPCCTKKSSAQTGNPVDLRLEVKTPFRFVAYGDTRFHDPKDTEAANPPVRVALVQAIAEAESGIHLLHRRHRLQRVRCQRLEGLGQRDQHLARKENPDLSGARQS